MKGENIMEATIHEDENGNPRVTVREDMVAKAEDVAKVYKAIRKELEEES